MCDLLPAPGNYVASRSGPSEPVRASILIIQHPWSDFLEIVRFMSSRSSSWPGRPRAGGELRMQKGMASLRASLRDPRAAAVPSAAAPKAAVAIGAMPAASKEMRKQYSTILSLSQFRTRSNRRLDGRLRAWAVPLARFAVNLQRTRAPRSGLGVSDAEPTNCLLMRIFPTSAQMLRL